MNQMLILSKSWLPKRVLMTPSRDHRKMIKIVLPAAIIQNDCLSLLTQKFSFRKTRSIASFVANQLWMHICKPLTVKWLKQWQISEKNIGLKDCVSCWSASQKDIMDLHGSMQQFFKNHHLHFITWLKRRLLEFFKMLVLSMLDQ